MHRTYDRSGPKEYRKIRTLRQRWAQFRDSREDGPEARTVARAQWREDHREKLAALEAKMSASDDPYENMKIEITGKDKPDLVLMRFDDVDLGDVLENNILNAQYLHPMPVQKAAIPIVMAGRDLMACAQTGSGKTAAFLLPIISQLLLLGPPPEVEAYAAAAARSQQGQGQGQLEAERQDEQFYQEYVRKAHPRALVLAPTRELAAQIHDEAVKFARDSPVMASVVYGGANIGDQLRALGDGCDVLVATPGRLVDLTERGCISLGSVRFLVLDEADRMLDMGFEPQIRQIVEREGVPRRRQTLMFSATFPKEIQRLASDFLADDYLFVAIGRVGSTVENIIQVLENLYDDDRLKRDRLVQLLDKYDGYLTLVFVETKRMADILENFLYDNGYPAIAIHGDRSQGDREYALRAFRDRRATILVATDVAARGLDIPDVVLVINYDMPKDMDSYVHRIGRTGRAGKTGLATSFISEKSAPLFPDLYTLMEETNQDIPEWFTQMCNDLRYSSGSHGRRNGGGGGGGRYKSRYGGNTYGGRDIRFERRGGGRRSRNGGGGGGGGGGSGHGSSGGYSGSSGGGGGGGGYYSGGGGGYYETSQDEAKW